MRTRSLPALTAVLAVALLATGCGSSDDPLDLTGEDDVVEERIPVDGDGGIGDGAGPIPGEPIPVEPDGGIGGDVVPMDQAPPFGVSSEVASAVVEPSTSCWSPESGGAGMCADGFPTPENHVLSVDAQLVVTYPEGELNFGLGEAFVGMEGDQIAQEPPLPTVDLPFELQAGGLWIVDVSDVEPGEYALWLTWFGAQGDSSAVMTLRVT